MSNMQQLKTELNNARTMAEFLRICSEHYDFENAKLGSISRYQLIANIDKVIAVSGAKPKK